MIRFIKIQDPDDRYDLADIQFTLPRDMTLPELREEFDNFCRAIGYVIPYEGVDIDRI
jgi:hypothetical protein